MPHSTTCNHRVLQNQGLPIAISVERSALPAALREELRPLKGPRPFAFTFQLIRAWAVIAGTIATAAWIDAWWATALAIVVVAIRQSLLVLLTHEQVHGTAYKNRFGDLLVNLFCAYPLLFWTTEGYAQVHLAHHGNFFIPGKDPDFHRKSGPDWVFPKTRWEIVKLALRDLTGVNFITTFVRGKTSAKVQFVRAGVHPKWARPAFLLALATTLTLTGGWGLFLLYWVLPLFTVLQLIFRWGALCEHEYNVPGRTVAETTPLIVPPWWQQLLLPNMHITSHTYHHYFPNVACSNLPRVHRLFRKYGLVNEANVFRGHGAYLRYLVGRHDRAAPARAAN